MLPKLPDVIYIPKFFNSDISSEYLLRILNEIEFESEIYTFKNEQIQSKRKVAYFSEKPYTYSNQSYPGIPFTELLLEIKNKIENNTQYAFNAVLCNHYENGEAGMGWHADKEDELGKKPIIASLSFGQTRRFAFRHRKDIVNLKNPPRLIEYTLNSGDLLIMKGDTQQYFEHCVIKDKSATETRINLTFRNIVI
jgi:alkylated DNA repair dioxygenase AlkB